MLISEWEIEMLSSVGWVSRLWDREVPGSIPGVSRSSDWAPQLGLTGRGVGFHVLPVALQEEQEPPINGKARSPCGGGENK